MTRGPANPIWALGSAMLRSPSIAKLARHASRRGIGQHRDVGEPRAIEASEGAGDLRHLHQRERAFHHPGAAGAADDDDGAAALDRLLDARA